jgi:hypothetical protein
MAETNETTPNTVSTLASIRNTSVFPVPPTEVEQQDNGMVKICIGDTCGWVSSYHLVEVKENQLIAAYRKHHDTN